MNVIMIVADTVVTDYLGVHGGHVHTPNLDRLAAESVDFLSAHAASFPTVPARACYSGKLEMVDRWLRSPLWRDIVNVPLFVRLPGNAPRTDQRLVSAIDLAPTITDLFKVETPPQFLGRSLLPLVTSPDGPDREATISAMPLANAGTDLVSVVDDVTRQVREWQPITVTTDDWTMLWSVRDEPCELYDRRSDRNQTTNMAADHPTDVERLHALMIRELEKAGASTHHVDARR